LHHFHDNKGKGGGEDRRGEERGGVRGEGGEGVMSEVEKEGGENGRGKGIKKGGEEEGGGREREGREGGGGREKEDKGGIREGQARRSIREEERKLEVPHAAQLYCTLMPYGINLN
jgi:hypothetical protein